MLTFYDSFVEWGTFMSPVQTPCSACLSASLVGSWKKGPVSKVNAGADACQWPVLFLFYFLKKSTDTSPCTERARVGTSRGERRSWRSRTSNRSVLLCVASKIENKIKIFLETPARKKKRRRRLPRRLSPPSKAIHLVPKIQLTACTLFSFLFGETCVLFSSSNKKKQQENNYNDEN